MGAPPESLFMQSQHTEGQSTRLLVVTEQIGVFYIYYSLKEGEGIFRFDSFLPISFSAVVK